MSSSSEDQSTGGKGNASGLRSILARQEDMEREFLSCQHVDFLSDFGRSEPFLLDGDAVIMKCVSNPWLDWHNGGQFLHLIYNVERFLQNMWQRGGQFDVFFLMDNSIIFSEMGASYRLARSVVIHHLRSLHSECRHPFKIHFLHGSWLSQADSHAEGHSTQIPLATEASGAHSATFHLSWRDLRNAFRPAFVMSRSDWEQGPTAKYVIPRIAQDWFTHTQLAEGCNVVSLSRLIFDGTRIFGFLFNYADAIAASEIKEKYRNIRKSFGHLLPFQVTMQDTVCAPHIASNICPFEHCGDFRASIYIYALGKLLIGASPCEVGLAMVSIVCVQMMKNLPLQDRAFVLPNDDQRSKPSDSLNLLDDLKEPAQRFLEKLCSTLSEAVHLLPNSSKTDATIVDIFDGRLFSMVVFQILADRFLPGWLGQECVNDFTEVCSHAGSVEFKLKNCDIVLFTAPLEATEDLPELWWSGLRGLLPCTPEDHQSSQAALEKAYHLRSQEKGVTNATLFPLGENNQFMAEVLGDVCEKMRRFEAEPSDQTFSYSLGPFVQHHFHNTRPLEDEPDSFTYAFDKKDYDSSFSDGTPQIEEQFQAGKISAEERQQMLEIEELRSNGVLRETDYHELNKLRSFVHKGHIPEAAYLEKSNRILRVAKARCVTRKLRRIQNSSKTAQDYERSLLAGTPVKKQLIASFITNDDRQRKIRAAESRLERESVADFNDAAMPTTVFSYLEIARSARMDKTTILAPMLRCEGDKKILNCFRGKHGRWKGRGQDGSFDAEPDWEMVTRDLSRMADTLAPSKREAIKKEQSQKQEQENLKKGKERLNNLKRDHEGAGTAKYLAEIEKFAAVFEGESPNIAMIARIHSLEYAETSTSGEERKKRTFVIAQQLMRAHVTHIGAEEAERIALVLGRVGFHALANQLCQRLPESKRKGVEKKFCPASLSSIRFQLEQVPAHLGRPKGIFDERVNFPLDEWQRRLLDVVDSNNSALVVAPTASGKTFISYYVMEQCLRSSDHEVVVYVAPTKALVNQVRAEISARFEKKYSGSAKLVSAFTRDFREENFLKAQILVTVPACLGILLLSGNQVQWSTRIRHIIFDEVHCIGENGGEVWEQLLLLMQPRLGFLALSATIGNVEHFFEWLDRVESSRGRKVYKVVHSERWNDIFHWNWSGGGQKLVPLSPCWTLHKVKAMKGQLTDQNFPVDLKLLPEHCVLLYDEMMSHLDDSQKEEAHPDKFFAMLRPDDAHWNVSMRDVVAWETKLKSIFTGLDANVQEKVLSSLSQLTQESFGQSDRLLSKSREFRYSVQEIVPLIDELKRIDMLPAICFHLSRNGCLRLAKIVAEELHSREQEARRDPLWLSKVERLEKDLEQLRTLYDKSKNSKILMDKDGNVLSDDKDDILARQEQIENELYQMTLPDPKFCVNQVTESDIAEVAGSLPPGKTWIDVVPHDLQNLLYRGIGVHHAGLTLKYRQILEKLFRAKKVRVIFATSTLAMGINMPSKTSVFVGDAVYLNAMNFRQMAGRAGRRGFDLRGHLVFMGTRSEKCFRLLKSSLPQLQGNLILSNSMSLRLIVRQYALGKLAENHGDTSSSPTQMGIRSTINLIKNPLFNPLSDMQIAEHEDLMGKQMAHFFRFSVEYLCRVGLIRNYMAADMEPNDLAAFVAHIFFMEPANFAFLSLILAEDGQLLQHICRPAPNRNEKVLSILSHLFQRIPLPRSLAKLAREQPFKTGPSIVLLPKLSELGEASGPTCEREGQLVRRALLKHNANALKSLVEYTKCFVEAYEDQLGEDNFLPVSGCRFPVSPTATNSDCMNLGEDFRSLLLPRAAVRSSFVSLSGYHDRFTTVVELCHTARSVVCLDPNMVPVFELFDENTEPLNSYALDFFKHGQVQALERFNKMGRDDIWDHLQSFSLLLKALSAAMKRRSKSVTGSETLFDDKNVLDTFESISEQFSQQMRQAAA